jgi:hypothetical protein
MIFLIFRESEKILTMESVGGSLFCRVICKSPKNEINQNQGEWPFFKNLVP